MTILKSPFAAALSSLAFLLSGCGGGGDSPAVTTPVSSSPAGQNCIFNSITAACQQVVGNLPYVLYSSRSDGTTDAAVNTDIVAVLSTKLDPASVNDTALALVGEDHVAVAGKVEYDAARPALIFRPAQDLSGGRRYTATVSANIRDLAGHTMGRAYNWSFTVNAQRRDSDVQRSVQQILDKAAFTYQIPGSIIAVRDDQGKTWMTTNGYADLTTKAPIKTDMLFRMGSNTKTYVATLILQLADSGRLKLDDPVGKYLADEMKAYMPAYDPTKITLRHLLQHTSGINNFTIDGAWGDAFIIDPLKQYFPQELLMIANSHAKDANAPAFNTFLYSNTNYVLLAMVVKKVSGMSYEDAIANGITVPWALPMTMVPRIGDATMPGSFSHGYWEDTELGMLHDVTVKDPSTVWSSGNMLANISELARWGELLGKGALLSSSVQGQRLTYVPMSDHLAYGLGIVKDTGANLIGHQGGMIGYTSQMYYLPDKGYTMAFFYNRTLALHDYSDVMTYDAIKAYWPTRPAAQLPPLRPFDTGPGGSRKPGFLTEY